MDVVQGKSNPYDDNGHGTNMAGILIADGWLDGIAKNVNLYVTKALLENGSGYEEDVVAGIDWCIGQNVSIISLSLGVDKICSHFSARLVEPSKIRSTMQLPAVFLLSQQQEMMEMMMMAMLLLLEVSAESFV